jgi:hypothetical protein
MQRFVDDSVGHYFMSQDISEIRDPDFVTGICASGTNPVFRLWNGQKDSNHRYTTDLRIREQMIAMNYVPRAMVHSES